MQESNDCDLNDALAMGKGERTLSEYFNGTRQQESDLKMTA